MSSPRTESPSATRPPRRRAKPGGSSSDPDRAVQAGSSRRPPGRVPPPQTDTIRGAGLGFEGPTVGPCPRSPRARSLGRRGDVRHGHHPRRSIGCPRPMSSSPGSGSRRSGTVGGSSGSTTCSLMIAAGSCRGSGRSRGRTSSRRGMGEILEALPDLHIVIDDAIGEGDKVAVRWTARATHVGGLGSRADEPAGPDPRPDLDGVRRRQARPRLGRLEPRRPPPPHLRPEGDGGVV